MFVACGIWCLADGSSVSPSSVLVEILFEECSNIFGKVCEKYIVQIFQMFSVNCFAIISDYNN